MNTRGSSMERMATWLSLACAVHCLVMPIALGALPLLGSSFGALNAQLDLALTVLVVISASAGIAWGYRRHRDTRLLLATIAGIVVYLVGHAFEAQWYGVLVTVLGALLLAVTAFLGARLSHAHAHEHGATCSH